MYNTPELSIQKALYQKLSSLGYLVTDHLPTDPTFPYIQIGEFYLDRTKGKLHKEFDIDVYIHIYHNQGTNNTRAIKEVTDKVMGLIFEQEFIIEGFNITNLDLIQSYMIADPNPKIQHQIIRVNFKTVDSFFMQ